MRQRIFLSCLMAVLIGVSFYGCEEKGIKKIEEEAVPSRPADSTGPARNEGGVVDYDADGPEEIAVFVCGQVKEQGVYRLKKGSRIVDAIAAAGGFTEEADETYWNLAAFLTDAMKIYVPKPGEPVSLPEQYGDGRTHFNAQGQLNLNLATKEELMELKGIGEKRASDICAFREEKGGFTQTRQLLEISGISEAVFLEIRDKICVE